MKDPITFNVQNGDTTQMLLIPMGGFLDAVLSIFARWRHLFPVQANLYMQRLALSSIAEENAIKTKATKTIHNFNAYYTSTDLILLFRRRICY